MINEKNEEKIFVGAHARMDRIVRALDKRVMLFEFMGDTLYASDEIPELLGMNGEQWEALKADKQEFIQFFLDKATENRQPDSGDCRHFIGIIDENGKYIICHVFLEKEGNTYGFLVDKSNEIYGKLYMKEKFEKARHESETDMLTGLFNRNGFEGAVKKALLENSDQGLLLIMDMDNFKKVNDMLGHPTGDKVLKQFAKLLRDHYAKIPNVTGRLGGDEFVVFISGELPVQKLQEVLSGFLALVKETFAAEYPDQKLSASIGAAYVDLSACDYASLYKKADTALYRVKESGKGNYCIG